MRERMAYLIMIGMLLVLVLFVIAVIGKGEYQPPPPKQQEQAGISHGDPLRGRSVSQEDLIVNTTAVTEKTGPRSHPWCALPAASLGGRPARVALTRSPYVRLGYTIIARRDISADAAGRVTDG